MATVAMCRSAMRSRAVPIVLGLSSATLLLSRQDPLRLDRSAYASPDYSTSTRRSKPLADLEAGYLTAENVRQMSGGSLSGFLAGLVVSVFSKSLVLLAGVAIAVSQAASSYGIDLLSMLRLKKLVNKSKVLSAIAERPVFNVAFGTTFALAAFFSFDS